MLYCTYCKIINYMPNIILFYYVFYHLIDSQCLYSEFECRNKECVPKSFQCDSRSDCSDGSDEIGCRKLKNENT